jgi:hypothetical protein
MQIIKSWQHISPEVTVTCCNKCSIANAVDENDDMLWNGSEDDGNVRSESEEDKGTDCEDGASDIDW